MNKIEKNGKGCKCETTETKNTTNKAAVHNTKASNTKNCAAKADKSSGAKACSAKASVNKK